MKPYLLLIVLILALISLYIQFQFIIIPQPYSFYKEDITTTTNHTDYKIQTEKLRVENDILKQQLLQLELTANETYSKTKTLVVFGMHHSGTSVLTKLLIDSGFNPGLLKNLLIRRDNKLKYYELRDAVNLNQKLFDLIPRPNSRGHNWLGYGFNLQETMNHPEFSNINLEISNTIERLYKEIATNNEDNLIIKDPRMCLTADLWLSKLKQPLCIVMHRNPIETAFRFLGYNDIPSKALSVNEYANVWEMYTGEAIKSCLKFKAEIILVDYNDLTLKPFETMEKLYKKLTPITVKKKLSKNEIFKLLGNQWVTKHQVKQTFAKKMLPELEETVSNVGYQKHHNSISKTNKILTKNALNFYYSIKANQINTFNNFNNQWLELKRKNKQAYATIVTANDNGYILGATILARSILSFDSSRDLICIVTSHVTLLNKKKLKNAGYTLYHVTPIESSWSKHNSCTFKTEDNAHIRWGRMMSKLYLWELQNYDKVVYIDTDTMILNDLEHWFNLPLEFYGERSHNHEYFNAGIMVIRPSLIKFNKLKSWTRYNLPGKLFPYRKHREVGCTEQEVLNQAFQGQQIKIKLNDTRHADLYCGKNIFANSKKAKEDNNSIEWFPTVEQARLVHWIGNKCIKPWIKIETPNYELCDKLMYDKWNFYNLIAGRVSES